MVTSHTMEDSLLVDQQGAVRRLTLNRPEKLNALNAELRSRLLEEIVGASQDQATRAIVIRGAGSSFSAGFDISKRGDARPSVPEDDQRMRASLTEMDRIWNCPIPIIAQVHGWCLAGATDIVFSCDLIVASRTAKFGHPGVRTQGTPASNYWLYYAGPQLAKWLLLTGTYITGEDAAARGMILSAHDESEMDDVGLAVAQQIALISRDILTANKTVLNFGIDLMGRRQLQRFAASQDAIAHASAESLSFSARISEVGLTEALAERNARFAAKPFDPFHSKEDDDEGPGDVRRPG
jgi:enoyl-CoA hydratase